jgi:hypothetical protein
MSSRPAAAGVIAVGIIARGALGRRSARLILARRARNIMIHAARSRHAAFVARRGSVS